MTVALIGLDPVLGPHASEVRRKYGRLTPMRLGMEVGKAGIEVGNPYEPKTKAHRLFYEGVVAGREMRRRKGNEERKD